MTEAEIAKVEELGASYRLRLHDLSWLMRTLNEHIARKANAEDGARGRFWEGRFQSQALLDERALLAAMPYVDLNPVRAGIAETPEASDYTSIQERVAGVPHEADAHIHTTDSTATREPDSQALDGETLRADKQMHPLPLAALMPFDATSQTPWTIPFAFADYLELVDWTGRAIRSDKRGHIPSGQPRILDRLGIDPERFIDYAERLLKAFGTSVGAPTSLASLCARRQRKYLHGIRAARQLSIPKRAAWQIPYPSTCWASSSSPDSPRGQAFYAVSVRRLAPLRSGLPPFAIALRLQVLPAASVHRAFAAPIPPLTLQTSPLGFALALG